MRDMPNVLGVLPVSLALGGAVFHFAYGRDFTRARERVDCKFGTIPSTSRRWSEAGKKHLGANAPAPRRALWSPGLGSVKKGARDAGPTDAPEAP